MNGGDPNREVFDSVAETYTELSLQPAERMILNRLGGRLPELEMMDLGVGSGRTAYTFAGLVKRYVGVDYSPRMVELARRLIGEAEGVEFVVADARDLSAISGQFDFALFSFNGIDAVGHEDRLRILAQVRAALKPDGQFFFSSHSLNALPLSPRQRHERGARGGNLRQLYDFARDLRYGARARRSNRAMDLGAARTRGWTIVRDPAHGFSLDVYYIDPLQQVAQLREAGFEPIAVFDGAGREADPAVPRRDAWFNYLCRPLSDGS